MSNTKKVFKNFNTSSNLQTNYFLKYYKTKVHILVHHVQIKNLPLFQFDCGNEGEISPDQPEQKTDLNFDDDHNEKGKLIKDDQSDQNNKFPNQKSTNSSENLQFENDIKRRKIFLQFSEPVSKQTYNTNSGYYDEICLRRPIITMNFTDAISKKTTICIKMFDSLTNKLIAELPLPLNIIPFDKKVSSKFRMINKFNEEKSVNYKSSLNVDTDSSSKSQNIDFLEKTENESENNLIDFDILEKDTSSSNIQKNIKVKKNVPKIKLFLLIHLSTFGQLPFHAQKGTLLKHLKDATRINAKPFGSKKDAKDKALSCNSIITPSPPASNHELGSSNSTPSQQKIKKVYDFEIFSSDKAKSTISKNSNSSSDYTESNDSSSEVIETLFVDNFSDQIIQKQQINKEKQIKQTNVFIDDFTANSSHNHHHSHHRHHHRSSGHNHHHIHSKHLHSNQNNQLSQQKNVSDDQNEVASYGQFNDKKHKNALLKVGSCGDIPAQCLMTDILVK